MTTTQFKTALQSELNSNFKSFRNPLKTVTEINTHTCIVFNYPIDDSTKEWLNERFLHGVSVTDNIVYINNPFTHYH